MGSTFQAFIIRHVSRLPWPSLSAKLGRANILAFSITGGATSYCSDLQTGSICKCVIIDGRMSAPATDKFIVYRVLYNAFIFLGIYIFPYMYLIYQYAVVMRSWSLTNYQTFLYSERRQCHRGTRLDYWSWSAFRPACITAGEKGDAPWVT